MHTEDEKEEIMKWHFQRNKRKYEHDQQDIIIIICGVVVLAVVLVVVVVILWHDARKPEYWSQNWGNC